ncbi:MAG TPA: hypothetical protein VLJ59_19500 [Mycobacteriales bacterium]|nr:hypothetical protein [Mycobacteriales bacterium]
MSNAVALVERVSALLDLCGGVDFSSLSDAEVDEVLVRGFRQVGRFTGSVLLPLAREAEARALRPRMTRRTCGRGCGVR